MALIGNTNEEKIWNYLYSKIKNAYGIAGLMGNLKAESGLSPINLQNTGNKKLNMTDEQYTTSVDNGSYTNFIKDSQGFGICQWTYWNRKQNLLNYAKSKCVSIGDLEMQLDFLVMQELQKGYRSVWNTLVCAKSVKEASDIVLTQFEKPAKQDSSVKSKRASFGQEYYDKYFLANKNNINTITTTYTNSPLVTYTKISPNKTSPRNHKIDTICIHCMAGNLSVETCGNVFAPTSRKASSNYGIGSDGRIAMYCEEKDRSWCSSNSKNDHRAVTIEVANDGGAPDWHVSDKAMASLIDLCADICKRNNIKKLVWSTNKNERVNHLNGCNMTVHRDFAAKACPGQFLYDMHGYIADEVNKRLLGVEYDSIPQQSTISSPIKNIVKVNTILNIRNKPNGTKVGSLDNGDEVEIFDYQNGWFRIGTDKWVSSDYVHNTHGIVTASVLNLRSGAGKNYTDIGDLSRNTNVRLLRESNGWYMVLVDRKLGWVSKEYIDII